MVVVWGVWLFFLVKLPKPLLLLLLIITTLNGSSRAEGDLSWSVSTSDAFFPPLHVHKCCQGLFIQSWATGNGHFLTICLMKEMEFFKKKTSVYFTFISSHSASLNRWVASRQLRRKHQNAAVCQLCLDYIIQVIF